MPLKDLSGKKAIDLEPEDFEKLFCQHCLEYRSATGATRRYSGARLSWTAGFGIPFIGGGTIHNRIAYQGKWEGGRESLDNRPPLFAQRGVRKEGYGHNLPL